MFCQPSPQDIALPPNHISLREIQEHRRDEDHDDVVLIDYEKETVFNKSAAEDLVVWNDLHWGVTGSKFIISWKSLQ